MGKCESGETSMNDLSGMVGAIDLNRPARVCLRESGGSGEPPLPYRNPSARKSSRGSSKLQLPNDVTNFLRYRSRSRSIFHSRHAKKSSANTKKLAFSSSNIFAVWLASHPFSAEN